MCLSFLSLCRKVSFVCLVDLTKSVLDVCVFMYLMILSHSQEDTSD